MGQRGAIAVTTASERTPDRVPSGCYRSAGGGEYLVVWRDDGSAPLCKIKGQRVAIDGSFIGTAFDVASSSVQHRNPAVAYNPDDDEYLVVYQAYAGGNWRIRGRRVSGAGVVHRRVICGLDPAVGEVEVGLGGAQPAVAEQVLDGRHRHASLDHAAAKRVAKLVAPHRSPVKFLAQRPT